MNYPPPFEPTQPEPGPPGGAAYGPKHFTGAARRSLVRWSIVLAIALVVLVFAFRSAVSSTNATCAGHKMTKSDVCVMDNGSRKSYDDQVAGERRSAWIVAGISALVVARSALQVSQVIRSR